MLELPLKHVGSRSSVCKVEHDFLVVLLTSVRGALTSISTSVMAGFISHNPSTTPLWTAKVTMPTRSGKSFSIVKAPQRSEDIMPSTSTQLHLRASRRGRPPSDAPPPHPASDSANKRVRKGKKERIRGMLAHMQRHVIDSTPKANLGQTDHNNRSRCTIGRGRSGKPENANQVSSERAKGPIPKGMRMSYAHHLKPERGTYMRWIRWAPTAKLRRKPRFKP
jgi:hypothetical protein